MSHRFAQNVSIVIMTHNRTNFVREFVTTLEKMSFAGQLIVSESSSDAFYEKTNQFLSSPERQFEIDHPHTPKQVGQSVSQSMNDTLTAGVRKINRKYAMMTCDDDIPVPHTLDKFEKFLDAHSEYNGVVGDFVWHDVDPAFRKATGIRKTIENILSPVWRSENVRGRRSGQNPTFALEGLSASERLIEYTSKLFHTMFTLVRAETLNFIVPDNADEISFPHFYADYSWMFAIALAGRIKHFHDPHIIRQFHGENLSDQGDNHPFPKYSEAMLTQSWGSDASLFVQNLAKLVKHYDGCSLESANKTALEALKRLTILRLQGELRISTLPSTGKLTQFLAKARYKMPIFNQCRTYSKATSYIIKSHQNTLAAQQATES